MRAAVLAAILASCTIRTPGAGGTRAEPEEPARTDPQPVAAQKREPRENAWPDYPPDEAEPEPEPEGIVVELKPECEKEPPKLRSAEEVAEIQWALDNCTEYHRPGPDMEECLIRCRGSLTLRCESECRTYATSWRCPELRCPPGTDPEIIKQAEYVNCPDPYPQARDVEGELEALHRARNCQ